jgi:hypothetical protein
MSGPGSRPIGAGSTNLAVGFSTGYVTATSGKSAFRCVRGGLVGTAGTRFSSGEGIVLDRVAGLVWEGTPACTACTWKQALQVCTTRGPGWRVPTVKELLSLVDPSEDACPKWDPAFGPDCPSPSWFWSSTPVAASPNSAFYVSFNFGTANFTVFTGGYKAGVRCVRTAK